MTPAIDPKQEYKLMWIVLISEAMKMFRRLHLVLIYCIWQCESEGMTSHTTSSTASQTWTLKTKWIVYGKTKRQWLEKITSSKILLLDQCILEP